MWKTYKIMNSDFSEQNMHSKAKLVGESERVSWSGEIQESLTI